MNKENLSAFIGESSLSIVEAMEKIDSNVRGILFVTDQDKKLIGSITDGDIRRWLISTGDLSVKISEMMNSSPKYLCQADRKRAIAYMRKESITALPILDVKQRVVDIIFLSDKIQDEEQSNGLDNVPVIIMAGGKGTRLYPYTKILPKPLIPVGDIPIIERIIDRFCGYGVSEYYMTVNYKKNMIKSYFSDLNPEYSIQYVEEDKPLGTAGSLRLIREKFNRPVIVTNCDILINADYANIYRYHIESGNAMTIVSALKNIVIPYGVLYSGEHGAVTSMEEKPRMSYFVNTGMYLLNPELFDRIPDGLMYHMTDFAADLMKDKMSVGMYPISEDSFLDMGEFEEMRRMEKRLKLESESMV
ncbi:MAG: NTP transferase domain-containing protein [Lachnospiraceae bacterium]|jgi:dTDP-glucose pyrophosphorylase|nr:NTP transferase domain-containing protein [Lachnospiraceae bacterium]